MTTTEKLFVQIFERKNWIIQQVKQQTDLYSQHLASKLLIDGITPPPWLWNPSSHSHSSDTKELNKEELISKLLLQHPRNNSPYVSGHCSVYDKPVVTGDNAGLSGGLCMDTHASSEGLDARDESISMLASRDNDAGCALNGVPEVDFSVNSPRDETDVRISNIYTAPDQSLARIQRSKSRQKALELRTSAKAAAKSCLSHENRTGICFSGNSLSRIDFQQADQDNSSSKLAKHYDVSSKRAGHREANEGICGEGFSRNNYSGGISKSRSPYKQAISVTESHQLDGYSELAKEDGGMLLQSADSDSELKEMVNPSDATSGSCGVREATRGKCWDKQQGSDIYCDRVTRSRSSSLQARLINDSSKPGTSYTTKTGSGTLSQSMHKPVQQLEDSDNLLKAVKPSGELILKKTRSQATCSTEGTSSMAARRITRSRSGATKESLLLKSLNENEGYALPNVSGCQLIPFCPSADVNQEGIAAETQLVDGKVQAQPLYLGSNLAGVDLRKDSEGLVLSPPSNCHMVVQPKQLDFGDMEECNLNKSISPPSKKKTVNKSAEKISSALLDPVASLDEITPGSPNERILEEQSQMGRKVSTNPEEAQNDVNVEDEITPGSPNERFLEEQPQMGRKVSTNPEEARNDVNVEECSEYEIGECGPQVNWNPMVNTGECNSEVSLPNQASFLLHATDVAPSDILNFDKETHLAKCEASKGCWSSFKLQIKEGEFGNKGKNSSCSTPSKSMPKLAELSVNSSFAKQRIQDFQNCLDKEVGIPEPTGFMQLSVQDMQNIPHVENTDIFPERMLVESNTDVGEGGVSANCFIGPRCLEDNCDGCSTPTEFQLTKNSLVSKMKMNSAKVDSWPQCKRRKVEDQLFNCLSASRSFRVQMPHSIQRDNIYRYLENSENISDSGQELQELRHSEEGNLSQPNANKSSDVGTYQEIKCPMTSEIEVSPVLQVEEGKFGSQIDNKTAETPFTFKEKQSGSSYLLSLTKKAADGSTGSLVGDLETADTTNTLIDARELCLGHKVSMVNAVNLTAERNFPKRISHLTEDGLLPHFSVGSPHNEQNSAGPDEMMPVFEGFIIDGQTENGGRDNVAGMINLNRLDLPSTTFEHASILEQICRSASMQTPSHFSPKFKLYGMQDLYQSVPNGLLERADAKSTLPIDMDAGKLLRASYSCMEEVKSSGHGLSYSNSLSYSGTPFGWNSKNHYASPVGKLWERFSSSSSSSEKRLSSNPELTCFPIEEDPSVSEENENAEEADEIQRDIRSRVMNDSAKRQPLIEITETCLNPNPSISAAEKFPDRDSLESLSTEFSFHGTHNRVKRKLRNHCSNQNSRKEGKENQTSLGTQSTKRGNKSLHSRFSKPKVSGKTSLRKGVQRLSGKEPKHNNIVSGITSFIPLVQQKQSAAICPGKRDIKVKALEAAEAAKRIEEKRENERKMKKETLKLERARIEKENLREMELNKKRKQEEQKKRDGDIAVRKRLREEEERREKERKRKRVAEGRREQKLPEEKLRTGKMEKDKHGKMDEKANHRKESGNPLEKKKNIVNEGGDENYFEKPNSDPQSCHVLEDPDGSSDYGNEGKLMSMLEKTAERDDSATVRSQEKSYDISPYQCSDDDEEEDDIPTTKFVPSWASVALVLPLQEKLDPDVIFPRESFCSMDEVLRPRRLLVK